MEHTRITVELYLNACLLFNHSSGFAAIAGFPTVLGCIDGMHVALKVAKTDKSDYLNRKGYTSVNVQAVCNTSNVVTQLTVKWPGSTR